MSWFPASKNTTETKSVYLFCIADFCWLSDEEARVTEDTRVTEGKRITEDTGITEQRHFF